MLSVGLAFVEGRGAGIIELGFEMERLDAELGGVSFRLPKQGASDALTLTGRADVEFVHECVPASEFETEAKADQDIAG